MAAAEHPTVASLLQQQPAQQSSSPPPSSALDSLACQWVGCGEHATSPEALYEHVCERHVGRKSTNNLNLQCQWGGCRTTTVKRDHITSHIRVHVPLKPHKCDFCGKSFKRPQDLKKHVKTHADDSILLRSPAPPGATHAGYSNGLSKGNGYYADAAGAGAGSGYGYGHSYPHSAIPPPTAVHGYAGASGYPIPNMSMADSSMMESRKRGHDMLEQFFSDAKRRQIDAHNYMDLGARFGGLHGLQMGLGNGFGGYNTGYNGMGEDYGSTAAMAHYQQMPQHFTMFNELKTKSDLMSIDQFLEQLQNTVYENPDRSSPPNIQPGLEAMVPTPGYSDSRAPSLVEDTPTPASNYSTNSPASVHSNFAGRVSNAGYPQLPSVSSIAQMDSTYGLGGMPLSGIGEEFQDSGRRRYSSSNLTRANPGVKHEEREGAVTPTASRDSPDAKHAVEKEVKKAESVSPKGGSNITLPPIRHHETERSEEERNEAWVENMRVIEHLRHYLQFRIERKEYDDGDGQGSGGSNKDNGGETTPRAARTPDKDVEMTDREKEAGSLYPVLRAVQASD